MQWNIGLQYQIYYSKFRQELKNNLKKVDKIIKNKQRIKKFKKSIDNKKVWWYNKKEVR